MKTHKISSSLLVAAALALPLAGAGAREYHRSGDFQSFGGRPGSYQQTIERRSGEYSRDTTVEVNHGGTWNRDLSIVRSPGELSGIFSIGHNGREITSEASITRTARHEWTFDASRTGPHGATRSWSVTLNNR